jgi:hypothetical protein
MGKKEKSVNSKEIIKYLSKDNSPQGKKRLESFNKDFEKYNSLKVQNKINEIKSKGTSNYNKHLQIQYENKKKKFRKSAGLYHLRHTRVGQFNTALVKASRTYHEIQASNSQLARRPIGSPQAIEQAIIHAPAGLDPEFNAEQIEVDNIVDTWGNFLE